MFSNRRYDQLKENNTSRRDTEGQWPRDGAHASEARKWTAESPRCHGETNCKRSSKHLGGQTSNHAPRTIVTSAPPGFERLPLTFAKATNEHQFQKQNPSGWEVPTHRPNNDIGVPRTRTPNGLDDRGMQRHVVERGLIAPQRDPQVLFARELAAFSKRTISVRSSTTWYRQPFTFQT